MFRWLLRLLIPWRRKSREPAPSDFLYNAAGLLVGPARQCHTAKGKPKLRFRSERAARAWIKRHRHGRGFAYRCDFGHVHISNKAWTRPIFQRAPSEQ